MQDGGNAALPTEGQLQDLTELKVILNANHLIGLYKSTFVPGPDSTEADFLANVTDYGGYAPQAVVISGTPGIGDGGVPYLPVDEVIFQTDDGDPADSVGGFFLYGVTTAPVKVRYYGAFNQPVVMNRPLKQFNLSVNLREAGLTTWEIEN